jgi:hypothetical protein
MNGKIRKRMINLFIVVFEQIVGQEWIPDRSS